MKLLLFILGITLCTASPSLRNLHDNSVIDNSDFAQDLDELIDEPAFSDENLPRWLFDDDVIPSEEGELAEEALLNEEEILPGEEDLLTQIKNDPVLNDIFTFGIGNVIATGIKKNKIPNTLFNVTNVTAYDHVPGTRGDRYNFSCEAVSLTGDSVINANFTVLYNLTSQNKTLTAYSYNIKTTAPQPTPTDSSYVNLTAAEIANDTEVQAVLNYGVNQVLQKGYQKGKIPQSDYDVTNIVNVARLRQRTRTYFKLNVELEDIKSVLVKTQFVVAVRVADGELALNSWSYQVSNVKFSINETAYTQLTQAQYENNTVVQDLLNYTIQTVVKQPEEYSVKKINAVYTQTVKSIAYYKYDVDLVNNNNKNKTVRLVATVAYNPDTGAKAVKAYEARTYTTTPRK